MNNTNLRLCCPCHFGLESVLKYEINKIGGTNLSVSDGKISFDGDFNILARANLCLSTAERVLIELAEFNAYSFEDLYQGVKAIPFEFLLYPLLWSPAPLVSRYIFTLSLRILNCI